MIRRLKYAIILSRPWFAIENLWKGKPVGLGCGGPNGPRVLRNPPVLRPWWRRSR